MFQASCPIPSRRRRTSYNNTMTATHTFTTLHDQLPNLTEEERTYSGYGASPSRPAPRYIRSVLAWERASQKLGKPYDSWGPKEFAAATRIYKNVLNKH